MTNQTSILVNELTTSMDPDQLEPLVSVILPAHNEERFLGPTLQAIISGMKECSTRVELIVVNDSSTDGTKAVAERYGAKVIDVELRNIGAVRNAGAALANGNYLIFVDSDTIVPAPTLQATVKALNDGALGGGALVNLDDAHIPIHKSWLFPLIKTLWQRIGRWAAGCYMFCTAEVFERIEGFPEEYFAAEEFFFSRKIKKLGKFVLVKEPVVTSSRKLHDYSIWQLLRFVIRPLTAFPGSALRSREGLEVLYEHQRAVSSDDDGNSTRAVQVSDE